MTARIALLMIAAAALTACESTKSVDMSPSTPVAVETATAPATPAEPRIVRSPVVADDEDVAVASYTPPKKRAKTPSYDTTDVAATPDPVEAGADTAAPVSKPDKPSKPDKADTAAAEPPKTDPAPVTTADASSATPPASPTDTTTGPSPTDTAPDDSATPETTDATPTSATDTKSMFSDPSAFMQAQIGGFPVWLVGLVGLVLLAALLIGLGGSRKKSEEVV
jgi:hypothetical protein